MKELEPIAGVTLEQYAKLCALMRDTGGDEGKEIEIAAANSVSAAAWHDAKAGWTARMAHGAPHQGEVVQAFMPHYQAAQAGMRGGAEPMPVEKYVHIAAELAYLKDDSGNQINPDVLLARYGLNRTTWGEVTGYWVPRHSDPNNPTLLRRVNELMQAESDRIFGIDRSADSAEEEEEPEAAPPAAGGAQSGGGGVLDMILNAVKKLFG